MNKVFKPFRDSMTELKNVRSLTGISMLLALDLVLFRLRIPCVSASDLSPLL